MLYGTDRLKKCAGMSSYLLSSVAFKDLIFQLKVISGLYLVNIRLNCS